LLRGEGQPWLEQLEEGFREGYRSRHQRAEMEIAEGPEGAGALAGKGVTIGLYACDRGEPEVLTAVREAGLLLVAADPEMLTSTPDVVVAAVDVDVSEAMLRVAREVRDGSFAGRNFTFDLGSGVLDVVLNPDLDAASLSTARSALDEARAEITAGLVEFDGLGL
jgi:hypothetical protein